jgi:hypothetical protein
MSRLGKNDRDALVMRYFKEKSLCDVATALKVNEAVAQRRVHRAVEKLRKFFTKRGVVIPALVLTTAISANSVQAAPTGLAVAVTAAAAKGAGISAAITTLVKGTLQMMAWAKAKTAILVGMSVLMAAGTTTLVVMRGEHNTVANDAAMDATQWSSSGKTEVVFWQAIVDTPTFDMLFAGQPAGGGTKAYKARRINSAFLLKTIQSAEHSGNIVEAGDRMRWLERLGDRPAGVRKVLQGIEGLTTHNMPGYAQQTGSASVNGFVNFTSTPQHAKLEFDCAWNVSSSQLDLNANKYHSGGAYSGAQERWNGVIPAGEAVCFEASLTGDLQPAGLHHLAIFQAVPVPAALADELRGETSTMRWLAEGPDGALKNIRLAQEWASQAGVPTYGFGESTATGAVKTIARVIAIGQPARWPGFWWDTNGLPVKASPAWRESFPDAIFEVVLAFASGLGTIDVSLRNSNGSEISFSGISSASAYSQDKWQAFVVRGPDDKEWQRRLEEIGRVKLVLTHGAGEWQEIGVIHGGESNAVDGGTFTLKPIETSMPESQFQPAKILIDCHFDYNPAWDVALAAVDKKGNKTVFPGGAGLGQLSNRENRWMFGYMDATKGAVDHFSILKRPTKEDVLPGLPTIPKTPIPVAGPGRVETNAARTSSGF